MIMDGRTGRLAAVSRLLHERLLWLLAGSYVVAALVPGPGLAARGLAFGTVALFGEPVTLSVPLLMLSALLFNAGLGLPLSRLRGLAGRPGALLSGLAANAVVPLCY